MEEEATFKLKVNTLILINPPSGQMCFFVCDAAFDNVPLIGIIPVKSNSKTPLSLPPLLLKEICYTIYAASVSKL